MKKTIMRVCAALLCMAMLSIMFSACGSEKVEKTLRIYNLSEYPIGPVNIVTQEGLSDIDQRIYLIELSDTQLEPGETGEYTVQIPEQDLSVSWYLSVSGSVDGTSVSREQEVGTIWQNEIDGIDVIWDSEEGTFDFEIVS